MPTRARPCTDPHCRNMRPCPVHDGTVSRVPAQRVDQRPSAAARGYGSKWRARRAVFLANNPICVDCGNQSEIPDHYPETRRQLIERGVQDPDAEQYLVPRCRSCHSRKTVRKDGAWNKSAKVGGIESL